MAQRHWLWLMALALPMGVVLHAGDTVAGHGKTGGNSFIPTKIVPPVGVTPSNDKSRLQSLVGWLHSASSRRRRSLNGLLASATRIAVLIHCERSRAPGVVQALKVLRIKRLYPVQRFVRHDEAGTFGNLFIG